MAFEFKWNNPAQPGPQEGQVFVPFAGANAVRPQQPQPALPPQQAAGMGADVQKLNEEYTRNEARIAQLEDELRTLKEGMGTDEEFQDKLAANRAQRGDTGFYSNMYFMRQNRANSAQALADEKKQRDAIEKKTLVEKIEDIDIYAPKDDETKASVELKRSRLVKELGYDPNPYRTGAPATVTGKTEIDELTPDAWMKLSETGRNTDGTWKSEEEREQFFARNPRNKMEAAYKRQVEAEEKNALDAKRETEEKVKAEAEAKKKSAEAKAKEKRESQDAIKEIVGTVSGYTLAKNKGTVTRTASNGRTVTVTKTPEGILYQCGEEKKLGKE